MPKPTSSNVLILIGAVSGILLGILLKFLGTTTPIGSAILYTCDLLGSIFINLLKMVLIPLIFTSIAVGISNLSAHTKMHRVWITTLAFFAFTMILAVSLAFLAVNMFKPGIGLNQQMFQDSLSNFNAQSMSFGQFFQTLINGVFVNPAAAMSQGNVLATVVFALFFGIALISLGNRTQTIRAGLNELFDIIMRIVGWIMVIAPIGIFGLLSKLIATQDIQLLIVLSKFIAVVIGCTLFHGLIVLPAILYLITKVNPIQLFKGMQESFITALSTSSSSATMPVTLRCLEKNLNADKNIAGFVVPLGTTINMDGTAIYEAVAALFIANLMGIELNFAQQLIVFFTTMIAAVGAPGIPSAGMVTMIMVLQSVGLPVEAVAILIPIDRPLDAIRTMVNVEGDAVGTLVVQKLASKT